jgi:hypothetical protein
MDIREWIEDTADEDSGIIFYDGLDDACVGISNIYVAAKSGGFYQQQVSVYDWNLLIDNLLRNGAESEEEAEEYISFNIENAYLGPATPIILYRPRTD